ncbi:purine-binding chemotaxis protein CheW [bacterium]|nr:purine-binding chemotaxis protein CheW [bacterium]
MEKQLVLFELGSENYGVDVESVVRIGAVPEMLLKPEFPRFVEGQYFCHGCKMPVVDLHRWFGIFGHARTEDSRIMVANLNGKKVGMIVSAVTDVVSVDESDIELTAIKSSRENREFVLGMTKINEQMITLVDLGRVLSAEETHELELI